MNAEREERGRIPHVVIGGGGFGGLAAGKALKRTPARVTLIDRTNHHLFQPLLDRNGLEQVTVGSSPSEVDFHSRAVNKVAAKYKFSLKQ